MNKHIFKHAIWCVIAASFAACNDSESDLLEPKVYFENKEYKLEVEEQDNITYDLSARVSSICGSAVNVQYAIADAKAVEDYNKRNGTNYETFDSSNATLSNSSATISNGKVYADKTVLNLTNLSSIEEGKSYVLPIRISSASLPVISGTDVTYLIISKPIRIMKVGYIYRTHIKVPIPANSPFKSVTYEALVYIDRFGNNNTVMGCEGKLILRIGDVTGGVAKDLLEIAGTKNFHAGQALASGRWYHVAFTFDQPTGKAILYINGEKAAESTWDTPEFDLASDGGGFFVGKVAGFMWGERPFYGKMSEVRLWSVARSENQIKQNMLNVDPNSDGLYAYYKLNGTDQFQGDDSKWYIKDASGHGMNGLSNGTASGSTSALTFVDLDTPVAIN